MQSIKLYFLFFFGWRKGETILVGKPSNLGLDFNYHDYEAMTVFLKETVSLFPQYTDLYSIGRSVQGRDLWVLRVSAASEAAIGTPHVKLVGNIHGNEPVGKELILHLIQYLLRKYPDDSKIEGILNNTVIHFLPSMNPDGYEIAEEGDCSNGPGRENGNNIDLNRSFPDKYRQNNKPRQPETDAVIGWIHNNNFVLSASLHGGAVLANYPLDNTPDGGPTGMRYNSTAAASPDDDVFEHLARSYAENHSTMHNGAACNNTPAFPGGFINGAAWYALTGGMQDYNYLQGGCMELTLELSCCKYPLAKNLPKLWKDNRKALLEFLKSTNDGLRGQVLNAFDGKPVNNVTLQIAGRDSTFFTSKRGEFWRILLPNDYQDTCRKSFHFLSEISTRMQLFLHG